MASDWVDSFGGADARTDIDGVRLHFSGDAVARVRATTAHDSYERLVDVHCLPQEHIVDAGSKGLMPMADLVQDPAAIGVNDAMVFDAAQRDPDIAEFTRFYLERRTQEMTAAGNDQRKQKKLEDDFTPRTDVTLVALEGTAHRSVQAKVHYTLDGASYSSLLSVTPRDKELAQAPAMGTCEISGMTAPVDCLEVCDFSKTRALRHRLVRSDVSGRYALPDHSMTCALTNKQLLIDEAGMSDVTNRVVDRRLLKTCAISRKKAEPEHFGTCAFTKASVLKEHLAISEVSGKLYRVDESRASVVPGRGGHASEFIACHETGESLLADEAERCSQTGKLVRPGILETCAVSGKRALPSEMEGSAVSGKRALRNLLVKSSVSGVRLIEEEGIRSAYGKFCAPIEGKRCQWSGILVHPDDIRICKLLRLPLHFQYVSDETQRFKIIEEMLGGTRRTVDEEDRWDDLQAKAAKAANNNKCRIEAVEQSPSGQSLAVCAEVKSLLGLRTEYAGMLYSLEQNAIAGRIAVVKRDGRGGIRI